MTASLPVSRAIGRLRRSPTLEIARSARIIDIDLALKYGGLAP